MLKDGHTENFIREFVTGSHAVFMILHCCKTQPDAGLVSVCVVILCCVCLVSGGEIRALLRHVNSHLGILRSKDLLRYCRLMGPGVAREMPYKVFGYDLALQFIQHVKYKQEVLTFVGTLISEGIENFVLRDVKNASKLLCMCSVKITFGAYQICCDILRVDIL